MYLQRRTKGRLQHGGRVARRQRVGEGGQAQGDLVEAHDVLQRARRALEALGQPAEVRDALQVVVLTLTSVTESVTRN